VIGASLRSVSQPLELLGLSRQSRHLPLLALLGVAAGVVGGLSHGSPQGVPVPVGGGIHPFVLLACLIGAMEELVYRGWLYGRAARFGWPAAVLVAAVAHAAYKAALFALPPIGLDSRFDVAGMFVWTVFGGLVAGGLRAWSRSVVPSVVAHVAFDAVVYAVLAVPPWWVWG
jgi:membrane protease YdiL (CAAX protease family)